MKRYEFSLWDNCKNHCKFCWTANSPKANILKDLERIDSIDTVIDYINNKIENNSDVLITGGELFDIDNDELINKLKELLSICFKNLFYNKIHHFFIITNLLNSNTILFDYLIQNITKCPESFKKRIHITTSYDLWGRFKTLQDENSFFRNLSKLSGLLPNSNLVVNTILTNTACNKILNGELNIKDLQCRYNCSWDVIPFVGNIKEELPTKNLVFDTLKYIENEIPGYNNKFLSDMNHSTDNISLKIKGKIIVNSTVKNNICGHSINYTLYAKDNHDSCFMCDLDKIFDISQKTNGYLSIELWPDCKVGCPFCFNNDRKLSLTKDSDKILLIDQVIKYLKEEHYKYRVIQIMGGEFFNGELNNVAVFNKFKELTELLNNLAVRYKKKINIYTSLINDIHLYDILDTFSEAITLKLLTINTSFNLGLTHNTIKKIKDFFDIILHIKNIYPNINIHIQSILSDYLINMKYEEFLLIYEKFIKLKIEVDFQPITIIGINTWKNRNGKDFKKKLIDNPITYAIMIKNRESALNFCRKLYDTFGIDCFYNLTKNSTRAETKWLVKENIFENNISSSDQHCDVDKCGHSYHFANAYLDSEECLSCDIKNLLKVL